MRIESSGHSATWDAGQRTRPREPARPASGTRRSRLHDAVGYAPH